MTRGNFTMLEFLLLTVMFLFLSLLVFSYIDYAKEVEVRMRKVEKDYFSKYPHLKQSKKEKENKKSDSYLEAV